MKRRVLEVALATVLILGVGYVGDAVIRSWPALAAYLPNVNVNQINGVTVLAGTGAQGAGAQRVTVATDTATIAGSAPGMAGTASTNVLSVQGIASMTPLQTVGNVNTGNTNTQPHICGSFKYVHITSNTDTQIVNSSGSTNIYICDFEFSAAAAQNFYFEKSSTGTCGSPTQIGPVWTLAANEAKAASNAYYRGFNTGASQQLCVNTSVASAAIDIGVYYDQY